MTDEAMSPLRRRADPKPASKSCFGAENLRKISVPIDGPDDILSTGP